MNRRLMRGHRLWLRIYLLDAMGTWTPLKSTVYRALCSPAERGGGVYYLGHLRNQFDERCPSGDHRLLL